MILPNNHQLCDGKSLMKKGKKYEEWENLNETWHK